MIVIDALVSAMRDIGLQVIEQPQAATNTNAHVDLWLTGFTAGGESGSSDSLAYETMTFAADVVSLGVARKYVGGLRPILRTMMRLGVDSLPVKVFYTDEKGFARVRTIKAHFQKTQDGAFEYESEDAPMPARFVERWRITITYPSDIIAGDEEGL
jgi:hypothetical protein